MFARAAWTGEMPRNRKRRLWRVSFCAQVSDGTGVFAFEVAARIAEVLARLLDVCLKFLCDVRVIFKNVLLFTRVRVEVEQTAWDGGLRVIELPVVAEFFRERRG